MDEQAIVDKLTKVCICKAVSRQTMKKAIAKGADTVEKVWLATGTGNGSCKGKRCGPAIQRLLDEWQEEQE